MMPQVLLAADLPPGTMAYYLWSCLLIAICLCAWGANFVTLPGNWIMVLAAGLFAWLVDDPQQRGVQWQTVIAVGLLAGVGEVIELSAGAAGVKKYGGSRRGMLLSLIGAVAGSLIGIWLGIPVPMVGSLVGAVAGGGLGAFAGAYVGEKWKGRGHEQSLAVSTGALIGRIMGTVGKLLVGLVILVVISMDALMN